MMTINLIQIGFPRKPEEWQLGEIFQCSQSAQEIQTLLSSRLYCSHADAWLFWEPALGQLPSSDHLQALLACPADAWHAGLSLGLSGLPGWIDYVSPTWMLNRDPDPYITATSWRLSLQASLIRTEVLCQLGGPDPHYQTLYAAGLELGLRYICNGAFVQHVPGLVSTQPINRSISIPLADQAHFIQSGFGRRWSLWAGFRAIVNGTHAPAAVIQALRQAAQLPKPNQPAPYQQARTPQLDPPQGVQVTVLIPTVNRYPYLKTLLSQLRGQTIPPMEIIVVDQTPASLREPQIREEFSDLPLSWLTLEKAGQCSSRNLGLQKSCGEFILFIDDDDEIPPDLIEKHLSNLVDSRLNISNGVAREEGAGKLPPDFQFKRISNVFPTNNTMVRKKVLEQSGLFDLAFDHGQRADHDLGMRLYLSGELMVLNPKVEVLHHHAPLGGLREHKARVDTYAASRGSLIKLDLPTVSDIYLAKRYYYPQQVREMLWISLLGTLSIHGPWWKRLLKILLSTLRLPVSIWQIRKRCREADALLKNYPQIPSLEG